MNSNYQHSDPELSQTDYLDVIFDGRHKDYGAYDLRQSYPNHLKHAIILSALLLCGLVMTLILINPFLSIEDSYKAKDVQINTQQANPPPPPPRVYFR
jgi:protein TonB